MSIKLSVLWLICTYLWWYLARPEILLWPTIGAASGLRNCGVLGNFVRTTALVSLIIILIRCWGKPEHDLSVRLLKSLHAPSRKSLIVFNHPYKSDQALKQKCINFFDICAAKKARSRVKIEECCTEHLHRPLLVDLHNCPNPFSNH